MTKIVINRRHGGFGLSPSALADYCARKGIAETSVWDIARDDPDLVYIVETQGHQCWGTHAELKVVEVPNDVDWQIDEYDGLEWVAEKHRTWS